MSDPRPTPETDAAIADGHTFNHEDLRPVIALCQKFERERDELAQWKDEQMFVESQWNAQAVAKELGLPLGTDIRKNILPAIRQLKRERDELREANAAIQAREAELVLSKDRISKRAEAIRCELVASEKKHADKDAQMQRADEIIKDDARRIDGLHAEILAMRDAVTNAIDAFQFITSNWTERDLKPGETIRQVFHYEKITEAKSALAKLKPFLP